MSSTIRLVMGYKDTSYNRTYDLDIEDSVVSGAKQKILDINSSLSSGTAGGFSSFFVSNEGNNLSIIEQAKLITVNEEVIDLGE